ncbi:MULTISPECIES: dTDP-4-dehydrorhamnose reductase [Halomicrobium]|uniref:dTDP-4-dehydrorhamnose reductase n=2 Tax=Halomicrobium mukohataei TaxID=57705 RepID=C7P2L8_HALMD|nr:MULTISPECIES: dTDP-4-dehydrorhamnose reductase [Halomicrobium]ACV47340.1 dTDP-4-dehydrorhamnose reductase [Halomicrobium mukohataei DSM 12286]QCD65808.1 dTDP-4-dehydrorhamnose reductase [Halomicrobium mukohataei]QFR20613.1 dTDP-4-dehydrorhamnose reductase [Halomicrobium sp. ZPS1]
MRLLVVGANGLLGSNVVLAGQQRGWDVCGTYHSTQPAFDIPLTQFDLGEHDTFDETLAEHDPDVVINCAAMTDVDGCETNPEQAYVLNGNAPGELATDCDANGVDFIHVSTDYVFDGTQRTPYSESADPDPAQVYGQSKLVGEQAVHGEVPETLIARLSFVWGIHRSRGDLTGFPAWIRNRHQSDETVPLFTDQWVTPTRAGQAAETLLDLIGQDATGLFHVACSSCVSPYEFGEMIAEYVNAGEDLLSEGSIEDVERDATRPTYSCLNVEHVESTLGRSQPTIREDVEAVRDAFR